MKKCILSVVILLAAFLSVCVSCAENGSIDKLPQVGYVPCAWFWEGNG